MTMAAETTKIARWKLALGYGAFSLVAFLVCLFLTFPYDTLRKRAVDTAADAGYALRIGSAPGISAPMTTVPPISIRAWRTFVSQSAGSLDGAGCCPCFCSDRSARC